MEQMQGMRFEDRDQYLQVLEKMVKEREFIIPKKQLEEFLTCVEQCCPWFPRGGTVDLAKWEVVGRQIRERLREDGRNEFLLAAFYTWQTLKLCLTPAMITGVIKKDVAVSTEDECGRDDLELSPSPPLPLPNPFLQDTIVQPTAPKESSQPLPSCPRLCGPYSPLQNSILKAIDKGEDVPLEFLQILEGIQMLDPNNPGQVRRLHESLHFKLLKDLKQATADYGPRAPYTLALLEVFSTTALCPFDWHIIARTTLESFDYLIWKMNYCDNCTVRARRNQRAQVKISFEMLTGSGPFLHVDTQLNWTLLAYEQIAEAAIKAWQKLPAKGGASLTKILQGPTEPFEQFVNRLTVAIERRVANSEACAMVIKLLAYDNCNKDCKQALAGNRKTLTITDMIRKCQNVGTVSHFVSLLAATMQSQNRWRRPCYNCGKPGHLAKECRQPPKTRQEKKKAPGICPKCHKGNHWASECRSRYTKDGQPIQASSGNIYRGQPWPGRL